MTRSYGRKQTESNIEAFNIYYNFRKRGASKWGDIYIITLTAITTWINKAQS